MIRQISALRSCGGLHQVLVIGVLFFAAIEVYVAAEDQLVDKGALQQPFQWTFKSCDGDTMESQPEGDAFRRR